jgi:DNA-binding XRE family transcriptional regulator
MTRAIDRDEAPEEKQAVGWVPEADTFARRLLLVRKEMNRGEGGGWRNASEAGKQLGIATETYRFYEDGKGMPRHAIELCVKISRRTGVDFGWLYGGDTMTGRTPFDVETEDAALNGYYGHVAVWPVLHDDVTDHSRPTPAASRPPGRPRTSTGPASGRPSRLPRRPGA